MTIKYYLYNIFYNLNTKFFAMKNSSLPPENIFANKISKIFDNKFLKLQRLINTLNKSIYWEADFTFYVRQNLFVNKNKSNYKNDPYAHIIYVEFDDPDKENIFFTSLQELADFINHGSDYDIRDKLISFDKKIDDPSMKLFEQLLASTFKNPDKANKIIWKVRELCKEEIEERLDLK